MQELSKSLVCIIIRGGLEIWVEQDRSQAMVELLTSKNPPQFIKYENRLINRADVVGIFTAKDLEAHTRRKNGEWQCEYTWHPKGGKCECREKAMEEASRIENEKVFLAMTKERTPEQQAAVRVSLAVLSNQRKLLAHKMGKK